MGLLADFRVLACLQRLPCVAISQLCTGGRNSVVINNLDTIILTSKYWEVLLAESTTLIQVLKSRLYKNIAFTIKILPDSS